MGEHPANLYLLHPYFLCVCVCVIVGEGADSVSRSKWCSSWGGSSTLTGLQLMVLSLPWTKGQRRLTRMIHHGPALPASIPPSMQCLASNRRYNIMLATYTRLIVIICSIPYSVTVKICPLIIGICPFLCEAWLPFLECLVSIHDSNGEEYPIHVFSLLSLKMY